MSKVLVLPDIHGRKFWRQPTQNISEYDKVIFLGDYLDPYSFEGITVTEAINNFKEIIEFKKNNMDKVILLLGNHDMPYYSDHYFRLSSWHCRHSNIHHNTIHKIFDDNKELFQLAYIYNDILFTHAGIQSKWLYNVIKCETTDIYELGETINNLLLNDGDIEKLFYVTNQRGGLDNCGSCIWADVHDMMNDNDNKDFDSIIKFIYTVKQVFGHTMQAFYNNEGNVAFGEPIEFNNCKMIDTANAYEVDCDKFLINKL